MPLNVSRFFVSLIVTMFAAAATAVSAQISTAAPTPSASPQPAPSQSPAAVKLPTLAEVMRDRISKAKAFVAVRNYNAAIYELENIRRETNESSVIAVTDVLLMNAFLEQGDYKRAAEFLTDLYNQQKANRPNASVFYSAVAAQVVKSSRNQLERYRALGLTASDRNLPLEAVNDIERMRETLELAITQAKEMGADKSKSAVAMTMVEEAAAARSALARDDYDARRWRDESVDYREQVANSRSVIVNAIDGSVAAETAAPKSTAATTPGQPAVPQPSPTAAALPAATPSFQPVPTAVTAKPASSAPPPTAPATTTASAPTAASSSSRAPAETGRTRVIANTPVAQPTPSPVVTTGAASAPVTTSAAEPIDVGSLLAYATRQTAPIYPSAARSVRTEGVVKVEIVINENGDVAEVRKATGPTMLQSAAKDAIRKWKFKPFVRDGQAVKANGFVNFNFSL